MYAPSANHGFLIRDASEGNDAEQQFQAREKGENVPQLVVRFKPRELALELDPELDPEARRRPQDAQESRSRQRAKFGQTFAHLS